MMSLLAVKKFIAEKKTVNLSLILETFGTQKKETLAILNVLIRKGYIKQNIKHPNCAKTCFHCAPESSALYHVVEPD
ncbi:FeoC-like transcriptional regulator [Rickettsiella grylli]|nr:FeoC-like transcriptional regulator [Rickettsiella grylli]